MIIKKLPHWVLSNPSPSFYETEGGTVIEQTAIMYNKMNELIESYNKMADELNVKIEEYVTNREEDQEAFEIAINQIIHDFTTLVETELKDQDAQIKNAVDYLVNNLEQSMSEVLMQLVESGRITIKLQYNENSESLEIVGATLGGAE